MKRFALWALLGSASMPFATPALACDSVAECSDDSSYRVGIYDDDLTREEQATIARIIAARDRRIDWKERKERADQAAAEAAEKARIAKCTVAFLRLGCPSK
jgi:hypothetical protein